MLVREIGGYPAGCFLPVDGRASSTFLLEQENKLSPGREFDFDSLPRTSNLEPRTSNLEPRTSNLEPRTSNLEPRTSNSARPGWKPALRLLLHRRQHLLDHIPPEAPRCQESGEGALAFAGIVGAESRQLLFGCGHCVCKLAG